MEYHVHGLDDDVSNDASPLSADPVELSCHAAVAEIGSAAEEPEGAASPSASPSRGGQWIKEYGQVPRWKVVLAICFLKGAPSGGR